MSSASRAESPDRPPSASPSGAVGRASSWSWWLLVGVALLVRGGIAYVRLPALDADPDSYRQLAENLANHQTFGLEARAPQTRAASLASPSPIVPTAYRPPLYPLLLSVLVREGRLWLAAVAFAQTLLGVATIAVTVRLAERWGLGNLRWLAAIFVLLDPLLVNQATLVMTETLAAFLCVAGLWASDRLRTTPKWTSACIAGLVWGLAALCRPTFLPVALLAALLSLRWRASTEPRSRQYLRAVVVLVTSLAVVAPWAIRNWKWSDHWIASTTHGGYTLLLGNNRLFYRHLREDRTGLPWDAAELQNLEEVVAATRFPEPHEALPIAVELETDQRLGRMAWAAMAEEPRMAVIAAVYRVAQLWSPWPNQTDANESRGRFWLRVAIALWYVAVTLAALVGLVTIARRGIFAVGPWTLGLVVCLLLTAVHSLYWSNLRMRAPLMPFVALVAAAGCGAVRRSEPVVVAEALRDSSL